ncbi:hypothetical protein EMIT0111MI5_170039 [Burkholderia sp. IT-111MI5]
MTLRTLAEWASNHSPFMPKAQSEDVCVLAKHVVVRTIQYFV